MTPLKLLALDEADLEVVSAHAQDAVMHVADLDYRPAEKRFVLAVNRFAWEKKTGFFDPQLERRNAVLRFDRVLGVKTAGIERDRPETVLSLLAIRYEPGDKTPAGVIELVFAGDAAVRLEAECIEAELADLGGAWETWSRPAHGT